ncbi:MAG: ferrous iron transport protein A [Oscillospiraceae bacterium]
MIEKTLKQLKPGQKGIVLSINLHGPLKRKFIDMGITPGTEIFVRKVAPLGDPIEIKIRGYELTLRKKEAEKIITQKI